MPGLRPLVGRDFLSEDDRFGADSAVILTYEFWQRHLGGDPQVLDRTLNLDASGYRIIGVPPASFRSPCNYPSPA